MLNRKRSSSSPAADHLIFTLGIMLMVLAVVGYLGGMYLMLHAILGSA